MNKSKLKSYKTLESWAKSESAICNFAKHILKKSSLIQQIRATNGLFSLYIPTQIWQLVNMLLFFQFVSFDCERSTNHDKNFGKPNKRRVLVQSLTTTNIYLLSQTKIKLSICSYLNVQIMYKTPWTFRLPIYKLPIQAYYQTIYVQNMNISL